MQLTFNYHIFNIQLINVYTIVHMFIGIIILMNKRNVQDITIVVLLIIILMDKQCNMQLILQNNVLINVNMDIWINHQLMFVLKKVHVSLKTDIMFIFK